MKRDNIYTAIVRGCAAGLVNLVLFAICGLSLGTPLGNLLFVVAATLAVLAFIKTFEARQNAKVAADLLGGIGVLVQWQFTAEEWQAYLAGERGGPSALRTVLTVLGVLSPLVVSAIVFLAAGNHRVEWACISGCLSILTLVWVLVSSAWKRWLRQNPPEVVLGRHAALIGRELVSFDLGSSKSDSVELVQDDIPRIEIAWWSSGRNAVRQHLSIPVPAGARHQAPDIVLKLRAGSGRTG